ncbi:MAG: SiaC family regulatory phosphoprotein [Desulfuromonadales bacterium]
MRLFDGISQTVSTPQVSFDPTENKLMISGDSYPENSFEFYAPIAQWVREKLAEADGLTIEINVNYMNSSSTKCVLDLLDLLEEAHGRGLMVSVTWCYDKENPRSRDLAEEFREEVTFPFTIIAFNE